MTKKNIKTKSHENDEENKLQRLLIWYSSNPGLRWEATELIDILLLRLKSAEEELGIMHERKANARNKFSILMGLRLTIKEREKKIALLEKEISDLHAIKIKKPSYKPKNIFPIA